MLHENAKMAAPNENSLKTYHCLLICNKHIVAVEENMIFIKTKDIPCLLIQWTYELIIIITFYLEIQ